MIDLNDMALFSKVVDHGGFSAAGRVLSMPKSRVSRRIALLEEQLGVRLLERTTRKMKVTEVGEIFYRHCNRIQEEAEHASISVSQILESPRGLLRVGASVTTGQHLLSPLMAEFMVRYPSVELEIVLSNRRIDILEEGFDLLVRIGELTDSTLISKHLGKCEFFLFASPAYLEMQGVPRDPNDLANHDCLTMSDVASPTNWQLSGRDSSRTVAIKPRLSINDFPSLCQVVADGGGITALPSYLCAGLEQQGRLIRVLPGWSLPSVEFHALYPSHRGVTPKVRVFLDFLRGNVGRRLRCG